MKQRYHNIVGFDYGVKFGYCCLRRHHTGLVELIDSGVWNFDGHKYHGAGWRFLQVEKQLNSYLDERRINLCGYEIVRFRHSSIDASHLWGSFFALMTTICEHKSIPYNGYYVSSIKRMITGKGNANKSMMVKSINDRYNVSIANDNEADAIAIATCIAMEL